VRAGTPEPALTRLRAEFGKVVAMPEVAAMLEKRGARPVRMTVREAEALVASDTEKWTRLIRNAGIRAD